MGGGSSSAKPAKQQPTNPQPKDTTAAPNQSQTEQQDNKMSQTDPNKNNQRAQDSTKQDPERKGQGRKRDDDDQDPREYRDRRDKPNERARDRGRERGDEMDDLGSDDDDYKAQESRSRRKEKEIKTNGRENRRQATSRERDESPSTKSERERNINLQNLKKIADELFKEPPDPVDDSKTYTSAVETYDNRLRVAKNERELKSLYDREEELLQNQTADDHLRAKHAKHNEVTRQTQESEYRLKLSALINCYKEKNKYYELLKFQREQEKREDMAFLMTLREQIDKNDLARADVLRQMDEYTGYFKGLRQESGRNNTSPISSSDKRHQSYQNRVDDSSNRYVSKPLPGQGVPLSSEPQYGGGGGSSGYPLPAGAKLRVKDEAARVMADSERNSQRAVDVRKADRNRINRELDSRASSVNNSSIPPR